MEGYEVVTMEDAAPIGDIFVRATECVDVIGSSGSDDGQDVTDAASVPGSSLPGSAGRGGNGGNSNNNGGGSGGNSAGTGGSVVTTPGDGQTPLAGVLQPCEAAVARPFGQVPAREVRFAVNALPAAPFLTFDRVADGLTLAKWTGMRFVELEEAQGARGLRVIVAGGFPSPWSQAAMSLFDVKGLDYLAVRFRPVAERVRAWTGAHNVPVVVFDDEAPRTGWAEIVALAERLGGRLPLVPDHDEARVRMFGLSHEILGEGGLGWSVRLLLTHASLVTDGREGWPASVGPYLAAKYAYAPDRVEAARARAIAVLGLLGRVLAESQARGHDYFLGPQPTALDVHAATGLGPLSPLPHDVCPMLAPVRHAFETLDPAVRAAVPAALLAHRDRMYQRHLALPVRF